MARDLNQGGRWPAVVESDVGAAKQPEVIPVDFVHGKRGLPLSPHDLSEGMPEYQDCFPTGALVAAIFITGLFVALVGVWLLDAPFWAKIGFSFGCGMFARWITEKVGR